MKNMAGQGRLARLDRAAAMQYIYDNFDISGEAQRMCANLFDAASRDACAARSLILDVLDGIGFTLDDLDRMTAQGIFQWRA